MKSRSDKVLCALGASSKRLRRVLVWLVFAGTAASCAHTAAFEFAHQVPLLDSGAGTYYVSAEIGAQRAEFLVDTGAGMVTISGELFERLQAGGAIRVVRRVALRLANSDVSAVNVYEVAHFRLGKYCDLGPLEVAVMERGGRNLLGLAALRKIAPFAIDTQSPAMIFSQCQGTQSIASAP